jgi:hypothetical protein
LREREEPVLSPSTVRPEPVEGIGVYERERSGQACRRSEEKFKFAGGSPAAGNFLLRRQKKVTKEKATSARRLPLRSSAKSGAAQLALRAQTVLAPIPPTCPRRLAAHRGKYFSSQNGPLMTS